MKILRFVLLAGLLIFASAAQATAQDDQHVIHLPLVNGDTVSIPTGIPADSHSIPDCPPGWNETLNNHDWHEDGPPDYSAPGCLLQGATVIENPSWGLDPYSNDNRAARSPTGAKDTPDDWFIPRKVILNRADCTDYCNSFTSGIQDIKTYMTAYPATLNSSSSQHVAHWFSIGRPETTSCPGNGSQRVHIGMGIGQGRVTANYSTSSRIFFYDYFVGGTCTQTIYNLVSVPNDFAVPMWIFADSASSGDTTWSGAIWAGGYWNYLFLNKSLLQPYASYVMLGSEMGAQNYDWSTIHVPLNLQNRVTIKTNNGNYPWQVFNMPYPFSVSSVSWSQADSPWAMLDATGFDYTSNSYRAN